MPNGVDFATPLLGKKNAGLFRKPLGLETRYYGHRDVFHPGLKKEPTVPNGVGFATPLLGKEKPLAPVSSPGHQNQPPCFFFVRKKVKTKKY